MESVDTMLGISSRTPVMLLLGQNPKSQQRTILDPQAQKHPKEKSSPTVTSHSQDCPHLGKNGVETVSLSSWTF